MDADGTVTIDGDSFTNTARDIAFLAGTQVRSECWIVLLKAVVHCTNSIRIILIMLSVFIIWFCTSIVFSF